MIAAFAFVMLSAASPDPLAGTWHGTSLCRLRPSPCHDEEVVYHLTATGNHRYRFIANKIVGGREVEMGELDRASFDPASSLLVGYTTDRAGTVSQWRFQLKGTHMSGQLKTRDGKLFRQVEVDRR